MVDRFLSRAKTYDGEWVKGYLMPWTGAGQDHFMIAEQNQTGTRQIAIQPQTICQRTGVEDKNGKLIFENDILEGHFDDESLEDTIRTKVVWEKSGFVAIEPGSIDRESLDEFTTENYEVIGNIFDNPESLEDENEVFATMTLRDGSVIEVQINKEYIRVETGGVGMMLPADDFIKAMYKATAEGEG